ncbi:MAG: hypothetical protein ABI837_04050, partial [Acidobacteriota bacterium]
FNVAVTFVFLAMALSVSGATLLFPKPIHIVRRLEDSLSNRPQTVDEYCYGSRIITVAGTHVTIVDYDSQLITEIDHQQDTYSITRFDEIARARAAFSRGLSSARSLKGDGPGWRINPTGEKRSPSGRSLDTVEMAREGVEGKERMEVGIDRQVSLSRDAIEALIGASYPGVRTEHHDLLLGAASSPRGPGRAVNSDSTAQATVYGLPSEQTVTIDFDGREITTRSRILSIDYETAPPEALNIGPGAHRVESRGVQLERELMQLDQSAASGPKP